LAANRTPNCMPIRTQNRTCKRPLIRGGSRFANRVRVICLFIDAARPRRWQRSHDQLLQSVSRFCGVALKDIIHPGRASSLLLPSRPLLMFCRPVTCGRHRTGSSWSRSPPAATCTARIVAEFNERRMDLTLRQIRSFKGPSANWM
jgi:hypothetical protein